MDSLSAGDFFFLLGSFVFKEARSLQNCGSNLWPPTANGIFLITFDGMAISHWTNIVWNSSWSERVKHWLNSPKIRARTPTTAHSHKMLSIHTTCDTQWQYSTHGEIAYVSLKYKSNFTCSSLMQNGCLYRNDSSIHSNDIISNHIYYLDESRNDALTPGNQIIKYAKSILCDPCISPVVRSNELQSNWMCVVVVVVTRHSSHISHIDWELFWHTEYCHFCVFWLRRTENTKQMKHTTQWYGIATQTHAHPMIRCMQT